MRLRTTALPIFFVTVKPTRGGPSSSPPIAPGRRADPRRLAPRRPRRKSCAALDRVCHSGRTLRWPDDPAPALAQADSRARPGRGGRQRPAATLGGHAGAEAVPALADELRRLKGALHRKILQFLKCRWQPEAGSGRLIMTEIRRVNAKGTTSLLIMGVKQWPIIS